MKKEKPYPASSDSTKTGMMATASTCSMRTHLASSGVGGSMAGGQHTAPAPAPISLNQL